MTTSVVLTIIGDDAPGLVEALSDTIAANDANWLESRMTRLGGQFAGLLRVGVARDRAEALVRALRELDERGLRVVLAIDDATTGERSAGAASDDRVGDTVQLELVGQDQPGIVRDISRALAAHGVNVEALETHCEPAPMSSETLFRARALLRRPRSTPLSVLRAALEPIANELMIDIELDDETQ